MYKNEKINFIWVIIFSLFYLPTLYFIIYYSILNPIFDIDEDFIYSIIFILIWTIFISIVLWLYLKDFIKARRKNNLIKKNGLKLPAYIESFNYDIYTKYIYKNRLAYY